MKRLADRAIVVAAVVLVAAIAADALRHRGHPAAAPPPPAATVVEVQSEMGGLPPARVPARVRLVPSSTAFLRACAPSRMTLALATGPRLVLRYAGPPCHLAALRLRAAVGRFYDGPATAADALAGNYADGSTATAPLAPAAVVCGRHVRVSGSGLAVRGTIRCR